jgi:hypothetical protein
MPYPYWQQPACPAPAIKIVRVVNGRFYSPNESSGMVEYIVDQDTIPVPGAGPLCVFTQTLWAMPYYLGHLGAGLPEIAIFSCLYVPKDGNVADWMWLPNDQSSNTPMTMMANGTVLAASVMLKQRWTQEDIDRELRELNLFV